MSSPSDMTMNFFQDLLSDEEEPSLISEESEEVSFKSVTSDTKTVKVVTGSFFGSKTAGPKPTLSKIMKQKSSDSLLPLQTRSRGASSPQRYIPPAQRSRAASAHPGDDKPLPLATRSRNVSAAPEPDATPQRTGRSGSADSVVSRTARKPYGVRETRRKAKDTSECLNIDERKAFLIGFEVKGQISPKRNERYYVRWNLMNHFDDVAIAAKVVEEKFGQVPKSGMWLSCKIVGMGPNEAEWKQQHPFAVDCECTEMRPTHMPAKNAPQPVSTCWQRGRSRTVGNPTLPGSQTEVQAEWAQAKRNFRIFGANINLVTGEIRQRGRADTAGSWLRGSRSQSNADNRGRGSTIP